METQLIRDCISGDRGAWDEFVEHYSALVYSTIHRTLAKYSASYDSEDIDDLHNNLFLSLMDKDFNKLRQFKERSSFATFLRVIVVRQVIDFLRRQKPQVTISDDQTEGVVLHDESDPPDMMIESEQEIKELDRILGKLDTTEQLFIKLAYYLALPPEEVAGFFEISVNAYYSKKSRIIKKIRELCKRSDLYSSIKVKGED
ncbi:MAG: sigma-70 family RNA polymerase sigma factor [Nitrospirota bacterium]|nr:MAG: sigma-70 family RNA polymerase sigma factor [Nitrospirota bacterium]